MSWLHDAACRDRNVDMFLSTEIDHVRHAKAVCAVCTVTDHCLAYVLEHPSIGTWGGTTETERKLMAAPRTQQTAEMLENRHRIAELSAAGLPDDQVAARLGLTVDTVRRHLRAV